MITYEEVRRLFKYNKSTGQLTRRIYRSQNAKKGDVVGTISNGYLYTSIDNKKYPVHRLIWLYHYGYLPENDIDHINRSRSDNRIENLRHVSRSCNLRNSPARESSKCGIRGVYYCNNAKKWIAQISINKKMVHIGCYSSIICAAKARNEMEQKHYDNYCFKNSSSAKFLDQHFTHK